MGRVILIAGPTAGGKTRASLLLASRLDAVIINADAMQVYRDIPILSAQPSTAERAAAPHHLFGAVDGAVRYSAGRWLDDAIDAIERARRAGRDAIVVGGTGLYFRALVSGLVAIPPIADSIRQEAETILAEEGASGLRNRVLDLDPAMARLNPNDVQRHLRAYEVAVGAGRPLSDFQNDAHQGAVTPDARVVIEPDRAALYEQCEQRFDKMMVMGAMAEASALRARALDPALPVMKALGAPALIAHLNGEISLDRATALAKTRTRQFAKRQMTWFRNQCADWPRALSAEGAVEIVHAA